MLDGPAGRRDPLLAALDAIEAARDLAGLKRVVDGLVGAYELKHAVLFAFGQPGADHPQDVVLFTYPPDWVEHYVRRRYRDLDPVLRVGAERIAPFDWATLDRAPPAVRRLFGEAGEVGVGRQGITVPSRGPGGATALFSVTSDVGDRDWRTLRPELMRDMSVIAAVLHARLLSLQGAAPGTPGRAALSTRERETLQWAAVGKTIDQTADLLGLSSSAVRTYLDAGRRKLGCLTKPQAVAVAIKRGLIS